VFARHFVDICLKLAKDLYVVARVRLVIEIALLNRPPFRPGSPMAFAVALAITIAAALAFVWILTFGAHS